MQDNHTQYAADIGRSHGTAAAQWAFDGNTGDEAYRRVLAGIEAGDPEVLDAYRPSDLSGDYASGDLAREVGLDGPAEDPDSDLAEACAAYCQAASEAFWREVERIAREHIESSAITELRAAGYEITFVDRASVTVDGKVPPYAHYHHAGPAPGLAAYVNLTEAGRDDRGNGQATTIDRSNYRSLTREFGGVFTPVDLGLTDGLGAFVADLPPELVKILAALPDHPIYDQGDWEALESGEIADTWDQYVRSDITSLLCDAGEAAGAAWEAMTEAQQRDMFWRVVEALEIYPDHDGRDVHWTGHYPAIVAELARRLASPSGQDAAAGPAAVNQP